MLNNNKYILDKNRKVIEASSLEEWADWFEKSVENDDRVVDRSSIEIDGKEMFRVSTAFLSLDHSFGIGTEPILFETMVFYDGSKSMDNYTRRYHSYSGAEKGHEEVRKEVLDNLLFKRIGTIDIKVKDISGNTILTYTR